jgi:hypothetical protein
MAGQLARTGSEHPLIGPEPFAASQLELPRKRSGTGQTEIIKNIGNPQLDSNRQRDLYQDPLPEERRIS